MTFSIKNKKARILGVVPVAEVRGDKREVACDIKMSLLVGNDFLEKISPSLRSFLYVKDKKPDLVSSDDPHHVTQLRFPQLVQPIRWDMTSEVDLAIGLEQAPLKITTATLREVRLEAMEGGAVLLTFSVHGYPEEKEFGALCNLVGCEVPVTVGKAKALLL